MARVIRLFKESQHSLSENYISLDEKSNLHKVCLVQTCCKYQPCKVCTHCVSGGCQVCTLCANLATTTYAMGANLYKVNVCNRFAQGKLCANSIFHPVYRPSTSHRQSFGKKQILITLARWQSYHKLCKRIGIFA